MEPVTFTVCPTPAAFGTDAGPSLLAVASSLAPTASILDAQTGADQGDLATAGRALASPVLANGRLITVAENGTVEGRLSGVNHPPSAPVLAPNPNALDATDAFAHTLHKACGAFFSCAFDRLCHQTSNTIVET